jgi:hypothetical protein
MAITMMGGLLVATILTLLFLPALYAAWFRVRSAVPSSEEVAAQGGIRAERSGDSITPDQRAANTKKEIDHAQDIWLRANPVEGF